MPGRGASLLRLWDPPEFAVVLGASGRIDDDVFLDDCAADGVPILRRSSGGGTVVLGPGVLCVTVILPEDAAPGLSRVDLAHTHVLEKIASGPPRVQCSPMAILGRGDLVIEDRKFAGSAQRRLKTGSWCIARSCTISRSSESARYLKIPRRQPEYRAGRSHADFLVNLALPRQQLADAIRSTFADGASIAARHRPYRRHSSNHCWPRNSRTGSGSSGSEPSEL